MDQVPEPQMGSRYSFLSTGNCGFSFWLDRDNDARWLLRSLRDDKILSSLQIVDCGGGLEMNSRIFYELVLDAAVSKFGSNIVDWEVRAIGV